MFLYLPLLYILGNIFAPLSYVLFALAIIGLALRKKHHQIIIFLLIIFIIGDSRQLTVFFFKEMRTIVLLILTMITFGDLLSGKYKFRRLFLLLVPFYILSLMAAARNFEPALSISKATSYFLLIFVAMHYFNYQVISSGWVLLKDVVYLSSLVLIAGLFLIIFNFELAYFFTSGRYRGVFGNPNGIGVYGTLIFMIYYLYLYLLKGEPSIINRYILFWGPLLLSIVLSFSRNALASSFIFVMMTYIHQGSSAKRVVLYAVVIPAIVFLVMNLEGIIRQLAAQEIGKGLRFETVLDGSGRFLAWGFAWEAFVKNPWIGRGFAFEEILFQKHMPKWLYISGHQGGVHNSFLAFLMNTGVIGTAMIMVFFYQWIRRIAESRLIMPILFATVFSAFFEPWLNSSLNAFTVHFILMILFYTHYPKYRPVPAAA